MSSKKTTREGKSMNKNHSAAKHAAERLDETNNQQSHPSKDSQHAHGGHGEAPPLLGEAALTEALAQFGISPTASGGFKSAPHNSSQHRQQANVGSGQAQVEPSPKTVAQVLGEITWLMTQSPRHKAIPLGDLEWLVMPAILLKQFRIFYKGEQPVGVAIWALVDDLVAKRIDANDKRLTAVEWKSGTNMRIIDVIAPFGGEAEMRQAIAG